MLTPVVGDSVALNGRVAKELKKRRIGYGTTASGGIIGKML